MLKAVISALAVVSFAGPAVAQSVATGDGRMMEIPVAPAGCTVDNIGMGQKITTLYFTCVVSDGDSGEAQAAVEMLAVDASQLAPEDHEKLEPISVVRDFLAASGREAMMDLPHFEPVTAVPTSNGPVAMRCASYDDVAALTGHAVCALDARPSLLILYVDSTMAYTAMRGVEKVMADATLQ